MEQASYHILIKNEHASEIISGLLESDEVELIPTNRFDVPQWQIDEIRKRKKYYRLHPEELISGEEAEKMMKTD